MNTPNCHVCKASTTNKYSTKDSYDLYRCSECGFTFVHPIPNNLDNLYTSSYYKRESDDQKFGYSDYDADKDSMRHIFELYLDKFEQLTSGKMILDIGCATGYFLDIAKNRGWDTAGVEVSEHGIKEAQKRGHNAIHGKLPQLDIKQKYNIVTLWDVLEHVDDPRAYIKAVHNILEDNGIIAINTGDIGSLYALLLGRRWHYIIPPEHLNYFTSKSIVKLLEEEGFQIIDSVKKGKSFSIPYILNILYHWQKLGLWGKLAQAFDKPFWRRIAVPINLRDNIFILARKVND